MTTLRNGLVIHYSPMPPGKHCSNDCAAVRRRIDGHLGADQPTAVTRDSKSQAGRIFHLVWKTNAVVMDCDEQSGGIEWKEWPDFRSRIFPLGSQGLAAEIDLPRE